MLHLITGQDIFRSREKLRELIKNLTREQKQPAVFWLDSESFEMSSLINFLKAKNLFEKECLVVCENILTKPEAAIFLKENFSSFARSANIFIFREENLESSLFNVFKKNIGEIYEFEPLSPPQIRAWLDRELVKRKINLSDALQKELIERCGGDLWSLSGELEKHCLAPKGDFSNSRPAAEKFNIYNISDAVLAKDRNRAWLLLQKALLAGVDSEEIFWMILRQIKNLLLVKKISSGPVKIQFPSLIKRTGLHPYVAKKLFAASRFYAEKELAGYSSELVKLYHNARRGAADFDTGLEKFLIKI